MLPPQAPPNILSPQLQVGDVICQMLKVDICYRLNDKEALCGAVEVKDHNASTQDWFVNICVQNDIKS